MSAEPKVAARKPGSNILHKLLIGLPLLALAVYAVLIAALAWRQESLLFQPQRLPADHRFDLGADVHEVTVDVPGARLNALHLRLPHPDGVVFFLHGNGGSLANWFVNIDYYRRLNLDLFMLDYRGYGKSTGRIDSQSQLQADVRAAWDQLAAPYAGKRRVIYGRSLGTGLAAMLAADVQPELTVLVSPYFSMLDLAQTHYPWVPSAVLRYPLRTDEALPRIAGTVLLIHGERDTLIPPEHSQRLQALRPGTRLLRVPQAAHNDLQDFPYYLDNLATALKAP
jgi:pimeloyl-ACP methyl ester carboxylesterase